MKKFIILLTLMVTTGIASAQQVLGSISSGSSSSNVLFSVGEVYVEGQLSGKLGVYSYLLAAGLLTSAEDLSTEDNYTIYPNPTKGSFEIKSAGDVIREIMVMDGTGKLVKTISDTDKKDIDDLSPGMYFLYIDKKKVFKIIKN